MLFCCCVVVLNSQQRSQYRYVVVASSDPRVSGHFYQLNDSVRNTFCSVLSSFFFISFIRKANQLRTCKHPAFNMSESHSSLSKRAIQKKFRTYCLPTREQIGAYDEETHPLLDGMTKRMKTDTKGAAEEGTQAQHQRLCV